jgi:hypothetical protein
MFDNGQLSGLDLIDKYLARTGFQCWKLSNFQMSYVNM